MEDTSHVIIRYLGKIYKIRKSPQESDEKATDRAWYIAKMQHSTLDEMSTFEKETLSHVWANEKYYNMTYH
jgi:hypothetical protein